jgi:hypothetical protein
MCRLIAIAAASLLGISVSANDGVATCDADAQARYLESVRDAILSNWSVPYADENIACTVLIQQNWRGEVLHVGIAACGDDPRVHKSVVDAAYLSSPIPLPKNAACFTRDVIVRVESRVLQPQLVDPQ